MQIVAVGTIIFLPGHMIFSAQVGRHGHETPVRPVIQRKAGNIGFRREIHLQAVLVGPRPTQQEILFSKERHGLPHGFDAAGGVQHARFYHILLTQIQKINTHLYRLDCCKIFCRHSFSLVHISS